MSIPAAVRSQVLEQIPDLVRLRRDFHRHPELGFEEVRTSTAVAEFLEGEGLRPTRGVARTGVTALVEGDHPGPTLLLRADMDALPVTEQTGAEYASLVPGKMHACGHDGHTAILMVTARLLARMRGSIHGRVKLMFQPAEEGEGGARHMIEAGVLQEPQVDAAVGLHLWSFVPSGLVALKPGPMMAAADWFEILVKGVGTHAATPDKGVDPILAAAHLVTAAQSVVSRSLDPLQPAVVSITQFHGGTTENVIPPEARLSGTLRTFDQQARETAVDRLGCLTRDVAAAFGAQAEFRFHEGYPPLVNDPGMTQLVEGICRDVLDLPERLPEARTLGGEDMAYVLQKVPGCFFFLGAGNPIKGCDYAHHHPRFDIDEDSLPVGVELFLRVVEKYNGTNRRPC